MDILHRPVLKNEVLELLGFEGAGPGGNGTAGEGRLLIDCTLGEGGHSESFLKEFPSLRLVCLDADPQILAVARRRLEPFYASDFSAAPENPGTPRVRFFNTWFDEFFKEYPLGDERPDRILVDLGISVFHYQKGGRGFSFAGDEPLDMRLGDDLEISAADIVNGYGRDELADLIFTYGEERYSRKIAGSIAERRRAGRITSSRELADLIREAVPPAYRYGKIHPATRTFQALRIVVNHELRRLEAILPAALEILKPGGRLGVIAFHSLEDRMVKRFFREMARDCICPPEEMRCRCGGGHRRIDEITRKPVVPGEEEIRENPPSRSARLRVAEKKENG